MVIFRPKAGVGRRRSGRKQEEEKQRQNDRGCRGMEEVVEEVEEVEGRSLGQKGVTIRG